MLNCQLRTITHNYAQLCSIMLNYAQLILLWNGSGNRQKQTETESITAKCVNNGQSGNSARVYRDRKYKLTNLTTLTRIGYSAHSAHFCSFLLIPPCSERAD